MDTEKGTFLHCDFPREELEEAKETARRVIQRNKRLGDLLGDE